MNQLLSFEQMVRREAGQLPSATVVRRAPAIEVGLFDEELSGGEDIEFLIRLAFLGPIGYTNEVLAKYRKHPAAVTAKFSEQDRNRHEFEALRRVYEKLPLNTRQRALVRRELAALKAELHMLLAYQNLAEDEFGKAASELEEANRFYRNRRLRIVRYLLRIFPRWTTYYLLSHHPHR